MIWHAHTHTHTYTRKDTERYPKAGIFVTSIKPNKAITQSITYHYTDRGSLPSRGELQTHTGFQDGGGMWKHVHLGDISGRSEAKVSTRENKGEVKTLHTWRGETEGRKPY